MKKIALFLTMFLVVGGSVFAGRASGTSPLDFVFIDADARAAGLAGAYTALATDGNALHYNPAGLAKRTDHAVSLMHNEYFQSARQDYLGFALRSGWGGQLNMFRFDESVRRSLSSPFGDGGRAGLSDLVLSAGYGRHFWRGISGGVALKWLRERIADELAQSAALDLGLMYEPAYASGWSLGAAIQNAGPSIRFQSERETLPFSVRAGVARRFRTRFLPENTWTVDLHQQRRETTFLAVGGETVLARRLALRIGYKTRPDAGGGMTFGTGWLFGSLRADYAFASFGRLEDSHRFSLAYRWGSPLRPEPGTLLVSSAPSSSPSAESIVVDADVDGVPDDVDVCRDTSKGEVVDAAGCVPDGDRDGVPDRLDACPQTPADMPVDASGCPLSIQLKLNFQSGSADIEPAFDGELARAAEWLNRQASFSAEIEGHTDNVGRDVDNVALSGRRAESVRRALSSRFGVPSDRLTARGYGSDRPVADNATVEGRRANRRVTLTLRPETSPVAPTMDVHP
jgi:outer membrane protein OmpA-like peptidoglycan-associated protein